MTESEKEILKAQRNEHLAKNKDVQRITAIVHLNELAAKDSNFRECLIDFYFKMLDYAANKDIQFSKINPNDILATIHNRIEVNNANSNVLNSRDNVSSGGNGILSDL